MHASVHLLQILNIIKHICSSSFVQINEQVSYVCYGCMVNLFEEYNITENWFVDRLTTIRVSFGDLKRIKIKTIKL